MNSKISRVRSSGAVMCATWGQLPARPRLIHDQPLDPVATKRRLERQQTAKRMTEQRHGPTGGLDDRDDIVHVVLQRIVDAVTAATTPAPVIRIHGAALCQARQHEPPRRVIRQRAMNEYE
jgi:hypothetical protein